MKRLHPIIPFACLLSTVVACGTLTSRLTKDEAGEVNNRLGLSFAKEDKTEKLMEKMYQTVMPSEIFDVNENGDTIRFYDTTLDEATGEYLATTTLQGVTVEQRLKNIVERNGLVNLDFIVTVPKVLIDDKWQLRVYPRAFKDNEDRIDLEPLVLSGADFLKMQEQGYQQYKAFVNSIVPDSLYWKEMIDQKGVARALSDLEQQYHDAWRQDLLLKNEWIDWRNDINKRYLIFNRKMRNNRLSVDTTSFAFMWLPEYWLERKLDKRNVPKAFAEYAWGNKEIIKKEITPADSAEIERKFTDLKKIAENERKKQEKEAMFNKLVKFPRMQARLDSIVRAKNGDFKYYYTQELDADANTKKIRLVLNGEIVAIDMSTYEVPHSDTLTYYVSAMVDFLEEGPHYKTEVVYRQVDKEVSAQIDFEQGSAVVKPDLANNRAELQKIADVIYDLEEDGPLALDSLTMIGYASPEGSSFTNNALSKRRTEALKEYIIANRYFKGKTPPISTYNGGENWRGITAYLQDSTKHNLSPIKVASVMTTLAKSSNDDEKEALLKGEHPEVYEKLKADLYPKLRVTLFRFLTHRKEMTQDTVHTTVIDEAYNRGRDLLRDRKYKEAMQVLMDYPSDYNYAICLMSLGYDKPALDILKTHYGDPKNADALYLKAVLYMRLGDPKQALSALNASAALDTRKIFRAQMDPELNKLIKQYNLFEDFLNF